MRIHFMINGMGLGHVYRVLPIMNALSNKHELSCSAFGAAISILKEEGYADAAELPKIGEIVGGEEEINIKANLFENIKKLRPRAIKRISDLLLEFSPDILVIDGYLLGMFVAKMHNIKTINIANCTNLWNVFPKTNSLFERGSNLFSKTIIDLSSKIIIPDFPPPYAITKQNIDYFGFERKFFYTGPTELMKRRRKDGAVVISLGGSAVKINKMDAVAEEIEKKGYDTVICNGALEKGEITAAIEHSPFVVAHGGHTTIMNALSAGAPVLCVPLKDYTERVNNSRGVERMGCGTMLDEDWIGRGAVGMAVDSVMERCIKGRALIYSKAAHRMKGHLAAAKIIEFP